MLEHPDITRTLETGYPFAPEGVVFYCESCGCGIREDDLYWDIGDKIYCPDCAEGRFRHYA